MLLDALGAAFDRIVLVTYGGASDWEIPVAGPIEVCVKPAWCPKPIYVLLMPWLHRRVLSRAELCYALQVSGALPGFLAKAVFRIPLVVRCGFPWSQFARQEHRWGLALVACVAERLTAWFADAVIATAGYGMRVGSTWVIPNGVDLERFQPATARDAALICWAGRMVNQKNLTMLLQAVTGLPGLKLRFIGDGPERLALRQLAAERRISIEWIGNVPNDEVGRYLAQAGLFVFPSAYEGDPKALLEAMACGLPVIASDIPAHRAVIQPGVTGVLSRLNAASLRSHILHVMNDRDFAGRLGRTAREWVEAHRDLRHLVSQECAVLEQVARGRRHENCPRVSPAAPDEPDMVPVFRE